MEKMQPSQHFVNNRISVDNILPALWPGDAALEKYHYVIKQDGIDIDRLEYGDFGDE